MKQIAPEREVSQKLIAYYKDMNTAGLKAGLKEVLIVGS